MARERYPDRGPAILLLVATDQMEAARKIVGTDVDAIVIKPILDRELLRGVREALGLTPRSSLSSTTVGSGARETGPYRILLAEDNAVNRMVVRRMLEKSGHTVGLLQKPYLVKDLQTLIAQYLTK